MDNRLVIRFLLAAMLFVVVGCAPLFSQETLDRINRQVTFKELQGNPEKLKGTWVMLAGVIVSSKNIKEGTLIEVLQRPMDSDGRPEETDATDGRFLVQGDRFLDPAVYQGGRLITVVGEVVGSKTMPIDEIMYQYPVLTIKELHLWRPSTGPRFFFGIGASGRI